MARSAFPLARLIGSALLFLTACSSSSPSSGAFPTPVAVGTAASTETPVSAAPTATAAPLLAPTPKATPSGSRPEATSTPARAGTSIAVLAAGLGEPDDVAVMTDGSVLYSDVAGGTVNRIAGGGSTTLLRSLREPEGIVVLPDGSLIIAEQGANRLLLFRPGSGPPPSTWLQLENRTGQDGVDGIARDPATGDIIVPDSPNGRVLRVSADGQNSRTLAAGLIRPTGAAVAADGSILVADELGNSVVRILPGGRMGTLARVNVPDDVAVDREGRIFVVSLGDNRLYEIDSRGALHPIAQVRGPQGLAVAPDSSLVVAESTLGRILKITIR